MCVCVLPVPTSELERHRTLRPPAAFHRYSANSSVRPITVWTRWPNRAKPTSWPARWNRPSAFRSRSKATETCFWTTVHLRRRIAAAAAAYRSSRVTSTVIKGAPVSTSTSWKTLSSNRCARDYHSRAGGFLMIIYMRKSIVVVVVVVYSGGGDGYHRSDVVVV